MTITNVYFAKHNLGYYPVVVGIKGARMNRPSKEFEKIKDMLEHDTKPPLYELLSLNAQSSFEKKSYILSLVSSFQSLEIFLENFLISKYTSMGLSNDEIEQKLTQTKWTKDRLKILLKETTGKTLLDLDNGMTWNKWNNINDKVRNEAIHHGKELSNTETADALKLNNQIIVWIKKI